MSPPIHRLLSGSLVLLTLFGGAGSASAAQCCQPRPTITFNADELIAGAAGNGVLRGPWVTAPWRRPLPRAAVFTLGSFVYERYVDHGGWSWSDFNQRLVSYALTEAVIGGVQWLRRKTARRTPPDPCVPGPPLPFRTPSPPPPPPQTPSLAGVSRLCGLQRRW